MRVTKSVCVWGIVCFIGASQLFAMTVEEQTFREELERRAEMDVSYEEYRQALAKILEPRERWDAISGMCCSRLELSLWDCDRLFYWTN